MKTILKILILTLIFGSCKKEVGKKSESVKSNFNLKKDITGFKNKMSELDTIKIWFNHSVCTYQGYELVEITKKKDSLKILTKFKEEAFGSDTNWKTVYEKRIAITDTIWKIEEFLKRNTERQKLEEKKFPILQVSHNENKLHYFANGLNDINKIMIDYFEVMRKIHPENINSIYGVMIEVENDMEIEE